MMVLYLHAKVNAAGEDSENRLIVKAPWCRLEYIHCSAKKDLPRSIHTENQEIFLSTTSIAANSSIVASLNLAVVSLARCGTDLTCDP